MSLADRALLNNFFKNKTVFILEKVFKYESHIDYILIFLYLTEIQTGHFRSTCYSKQTAIFRNSFYSLSVITYFFELAFGVPVGYHPMATMQVRQKFMTWQYTILLAKEQIIKRI